VCQIRRRSAAHRLLYTVKRIQSRDGLKFSKAARWATNERMTPTFNICLIRCRRGLSTLQFGRFVWCENCMSSQSGESRLDKSGSAAAGDSCKPGRVAVTFRHLLKASDIHRITAIQLVLHYTAHYTKTHECMSLCVPEHSSCRALIDAGIKVDGQKDRKSCVSSA